MGRWHNTPEERKKLNFRKKPEEVVRELSEGAGESDMDMPLVRVWVNRHSHYGMEVKYRNVNTKYQVSPYVCQCFLVTS